MHFWHHSIHHILVMMLHNVSSLPTLKYRSRMSLSLPYEIIVPNMNTLHQKCKKGSLYGQRIFYFFWKKSVYVYNCCIIMMYSISSKNNNTFLALVSNKMLVIKTGTSDSKRLDRKAYREDPDQKQSGLSLCCLSRPFWQATTSVQNFRTLMVSDLSSKVLVNSHQYSQYKARIFLRK